MEKKRVLPCVFCDKPTETYEDVDEDCKIICCICYQCAVEKQLRCQKINKNNGLTIENIIPPERGLFWEKEDKKSFDAADFLSGVNDDLLSRPDKDNH